MNKQNTPSILDSYFRLSERGSSVRQELRGGLVTFFAMAYILVLNPIILSGPDSTGQFLGGGSEPNLPAIAAGTAIVAGLMSILMGAVANFPLALAAGLGLVAIPLVAMVAGKIYSNSILHTGKRLSLAQGFRGQ